jgi:hypothetical protein
MELRDEWFTHGARNSAATIGGVQFYFHRQSVSTISAEIAQTAVAHEIAHAIQKATGEWGKQSPIPKMNPEERADFLAKHLRCEKAKLGSVLIALGKTPERMVEYILSDDERRTKEILGTWDFDPKLLD